MKKVNVIISVLKGVFVAVGITVIGVALLALLAKDTESNIISLISVIIKILSIVAGSVIASIKLRKKGALAGIMVSVPYWVVCILLSLLVEPLQFSIKMLLDLVLTVLAGAFSGILTVNTLK